jgi:hypothetical protein
MDFLTPQKRTLFQDIFGKSAFSNLSNETRPSKLQPTTAHSRTGREVVGIFDGPAYFMPSLESLFEPLINDFLKTRHEDTKITTQSIAETEDDNVDIEEENGEWSLMRPQRKWIGSREEMDSFVNLFKMHAINGMFPRLLFVDAYPSFRAQLNHRQHHLTLVTQMVHQKAKSMVLLITRCPPFLAPKNKTVFQGDEKI